ncbi:ATP-binding protein [Streptomyces sp. NPDC003753]|uniref:ATP-binding protein n=1 Tax=unclassified Streptomyces TaxID=2593676 RepID=UPI001906CCF9|nr:ATP-binding protein [Streptomyces sp. Y2F8-2]GHJ99822.1 hypothetical protein SY2F82_16200 [Streptomyces sp. Y2F8-2]
MPTLDRLPNRGGGSSLPTPPPRPEDARASATACCTWPAERRTPARARAFARSRLAAWGVGEATAESADVVISEFVTNTVVHSGASELTLRLFRGPSELRIEVVDSGRWRRPNARPTRDGNMAESGRGLWMVETLTQRCGVHHTRHGTTAWALLAAV